MAWTPSPRHPSLNSVPRSLSPKASLHRLQQAFQAEIAHLPLAGRLHGKHCLPEAAFCSRFAGLIWILAWRFWVNLATDVPKRFMATSAQSLPSSACSRLRHSHIQTLLPPAPPLGKRPLLKSVPPSSSVLTDSGPYLLCFVQLFLQEFRPLFTDLH